MVVVDDNDDDASRNTVVGLGSRSCLVVCCLARYCCEMWFLAVPKTQNQKIALFLKQDRFIH